MAKTATYMSKQQHIPPKQHQYSTKKAPYSTKTAPIPYIKGCSKSYGYIKVVTTR
jgi:hypothetical protein